MNLADSFSNPDHKKILDIDHQSYDTTQFPKNMDQNSLYPYQQANAQENHQSQSQPPATLWPSQAQEDAGPSNPYIIQSKEYIDLKTKYDNMQKQYEKDKKFYNQALETRTNQLDDMEEQNEKMKADLVISKQKNEELQE